MTQKEKDKLLEEVSQNTVKKTATNSNDKKVAEKPSLAAIKYEDEKMMKKLTTTKSGPDSKSDMTLNDVAKLTQGTRKKNAKEQKAKIRIDDMSELPTHLTVIDLNIVPEVKPIIVDDNYEEVRSANAPEVASILKLKRKTRKEIKKEKKRLKKAGRIVTRNHVKKLRKGLEVPRYKVKLDYGLTDDVIVRRVNEGLVNGKVDSTSKTYKRILFSNIFTFFNFLTVGIAGWLITVGAFQDLIFLIIVLANMVIGIYQEIKAKITIDRLSILSAPSASVLRNGEIKEMPISKLVVDDIMLLEAGRQIVTDCIVVDGIIEVNESLLTGESDAIVKKPGDLLYGGSFVVSGTSKVRVERVGKDNFIETLTAQAKKQNKPKSELLKALNTIIRVMSIVIIIVGGLLFWMQYQALPEIERNYESAVRATAAAMLGMVPAGLFLTTSVALFVGVVKLAEYNVLVRELYSLEMLARINVLCLDKTGTITDGTMNVKNVVEYSTVGGLDTKSIISAMLNALNDRNLTSVALEDKFGLDKKIKFDETIPFSSSRKYSGVDFGRYGTFIMGAPEIILKHKFATLESEVNKYSKEGFRVILLAHSAEKIVNQEVDLKTFQAVSLILIEDNIRPDAIETIKYFKESGVEVKVISGDNPLTVSKIGQRAGINNAERCISLDGLTDEEVVQAADKFTVFGRVSPGQKKLLVKTLKKQDKVVAMTGDGVNDILALKEADCSIAVASGSEAARSVSHLVLLDSNFGSMPRVVSEGRRVINNIAKVASLFLTKTIFSLLLAIQAIQRGGMYPIRPIQLLMIDLLVIGIPSFVLILEPNNAKAVGNFLFKIIKGALPGAVAILITTVIVFGLQDSFNLDFRQTSTIIVISATFTAMMVLFEVCKPFNALRKGLCTAMFGVFVFVTILMPQIFEFSPLINFGTFIDPSEEIIRAWNNPGIAETEANQLVFDNKIITNNGERHSHNPGDIVSGRVAVRDADGNYFLTVQMTSMMGSNAAPIPTNHRILLPQLITTQIDTNYLVFDAILTNILDESQDYRVFVLPNGDVVIGILNDNGTIENQSEVLINILPQVGVAVNGDETRLIINGNSTDINTVASVETLEITTRMIDNVEKYVLLINGESVTSESAPSGIIIDTPALSTDGTYFAIAGTVVTKTSINNKVVGVEQNQENPITLEDLDLESTGQVSINGAVTEVNQLPQVRSTENSRYWIINDLVTHYPVTGRHNQRDLSFANVNITSGFGTANQTGEARLVINQTVTHFLVDISIIVGGEVPILPLNATILLLLLCAISSPLIRLLKSIIPFIRKNIDNFFELISKM